LKPLKYFYYLECIAQWLRAIFIIQLVHRNAFQKELICFQHQTNNFVIWATCADEEDLKFLRL